MLIIFGLRVCYRSTGQGIFHCERCGGDREYRHRVGRRWFTLFFLPVIPLGRAGEHVRCTVCGTRYRMPVLALPTVAQMQAAIPAGMRAAAVIMLRAGGGSGAAARRRAVDGIRGAGLSDYDDAALGADLAAAALPGQPGPDLAGVLNRLGLQLEVAAREWFLAETVRIGLADGALTGDERHAAQQIAAYLGMTPAQARGVISMTEENASA
ncbi:MAG TPA: zinc ribbon domain-containing protein [Streptosporangiaceae bacterium]|nr:zinc ribbon domain-containing protein [Streptosporangiaceae bacterium]